MIAAVKAWRAVLTALLFITAAPAADDPVGAARELARRTVGFAGKNEPVSITWRNASSLTPLESSQTRSAFESALREAGGRVADTASLEAHITLSESQAQFLLVEEIHRGEERHVWIASWNRARAGKPSTAWTLSRKLVLEDQEPILDVALTGNSALALTTSQIGGVPLRLPRPLPRDPRGRLRVTGSTFQAYLPGVLCTGTTEPTVTVECRASDEPWVVESGSRALILAAFAPGRNYFDGRITTQTGQHKSVPPFYSGAGIGSTWMLATLDGRIQIYDAAFDPVGSISGWGSDVAGIDSCGSAILATRAGDETAPDAIQVFNAQGAPVADALELPGPVTALWPSGGNAAIVVVHNLASGRYEAYEMTVACGG
jgi:hypothetical protein